MVVGLDGYFLLFFDIFEVYLISDVCEVSVCDEIRYIEFFFDDKFIFFGYFDEWFLVEWRCVERILEFLGNFNFYYWGVFICDEKFIVVKKFMVVGK